MPTNKRHFLNVVAGELGIVIEHKPTTKGGGEIPTAHEVLESDIDLEGKIVLADAFAYKRYNASIILKKKEPRMSSSVKGNQGILEGELAALFCDAPRKVSRAVYSFEQYEKQHGRFEYRKFRF